MWFLRSFCTLSAHSKSKTIAETSLELPGTYSNAKY
jgi:hypothetical protein